MSCDVLTDYAKRCDNLVKIYGRYCGPNWTAGKVRAAADTPKSEFERVRPIDKLDAACQIHDWECRQGGCSRKADVRLAFRANQVLKSRSSTKTQKKFARIIRDGISLASLTRLK